MDIVRSISRLVGAAFMCLTVNGVGFAQTTSPPDEHRHEKPAEATRDQGPSRAGMSREGSGTSWLPDETPMYVIHKTSGPWMLMVHGNAFVQFLHESGTRGSHQFGSINWVMGAAQRPVGRGTLGLRAMFSAEPATIPGCGYPDLLASGERCDGEPIHDRQHPHDLFMELAASYDAPLTRHARWQLYVAPAGEPALGPVAFPHRISAMATPLAPISHHWMDATHISFGVVTGGVYGGRWKAEASLFNGREPNEQRTNLDLGRLDSVSGRLWLLPTSRLAFQVSIGDLTEAEEGDHGGPPIDVVRMTASATYHHPFDGTSLWATTVAWGRNREAAHGSNAVLLETTLTLDDRDTWYGRVETVAKNAHDLAIPDSDEQFTVAKLQAGYTRYLQSFGAFQPGVGAGVSLGIVPDSLKAQYGNRANAGVALYLTLRPAR